MIIMSFFYYYLFFHFPMYLRKCHKTFFLYLTSYKKYKLGFFLKLLLLLGATHLPCTPYTSSIRKQNFQFTGNLGPKYCLKSENIQGLLFFSPHIIHTKKKTKGKKNKDTNKGSRILKNLHNNIIFYFCSHYKFLLFCLFSISRIFHNKTKTNTNKSKKLELPNSSVPFYLQAPFELMGWLTNYFLHSNILT